MGNKITIRSKYKSPRNVLKNDKITIQYPTEITISTLQSDYKVYISSTLISTTVSFPGSNTVEISPFATAYFQPDIEVYMTITWPGAVVQTSNFTITMLRLITGVGYVMTEQSKCCAFWIKEKPTMVAALAIVNTERLKTNVKYTFDLTHVFAVLSATDSVVIQFPAVFQMDTSKQAVVCASVTFALMSNPSNLNSSVTCTLSSNVLSFTNIFKSSQNPSLLTIAINVTNPSISPNENFQIWSQDSTGAKIESNGALSLTIGPASLNTVTVTPSSLVTNHGSDYQLAISAIGTVIKNTIIVMKIPQ